MTATDEMVIHRMNFENAVNAAMHEFRKKTGMCVTAIRVGSMVVRYIAEPMPLLVNKGIAFDCEESVVRGNTA